MQSFIKDLGENCTNALQKTNKDRHFMFGGSPVFKKKKEEKRKKKKKAGHLTGLLSRSYFNLSPERSGSRPADTESRFGSTNEALPSVCCLAQQQRPQADMRRGSGAGFISLSLSLL